ncbi:hypothetical protein JCM11491_005700 [Sporobolomyces phaffii]
MPTVLFFGVFIKSSALCFAAEAFHAQRQTLLALDLIRSRRRNGCLVLASPSSIARVPDEIWRVVAHQLVESATIDAEERAFEFFKCRCVSYDHSQILAGRWTRARFSRACDPDLFFAGDGMRGMLERRSNQIDSLLDTVGLALPLDSYHQTSKLDDLEALSAIGLRLCSTEDPSAPSTTTIRPRDCPALSHSIAQISNSTLLPVARVSVHLERFLSLFSVRVENPSSPTLYAAGAVIPFCARRTLRAHDPVM